MALMAGRAAARRGFSIVEALITLLLGAALTQAAWKFLLMQQDMARTLTGRAEILQTTRITHSILRRELHFGVLGRDWTLAEGDSVGLRAFRGLGFVCAAPGESDVLVAHYEGIRAPNPAKDSLLLLAMGGRWVARKLEAVRSSSGTCSDLLPGPAKRWILDRPVDPEGLARLFERGSYHIHDTAFRYRPGRGGRQPLTPPRLGEGSSLAAIPGGGVALVLSSPLEGSVPWVSEDPFVIWPWEDSR